MKVETTDSMTTILGSDVGVTIYDTDFQLIAWNDQYAQMGLTPKSDIKYGLHLVDTYSMASRLGIFGPGNPDELAEQRFQEASSGRSPRSESFQSPQGFEVNVRRFFLPNIGVAAIFAESTDVQQELRARQRKSTLNLMNMMRRESQHSFNNQLSTILANIEFAKLTGDMTFLDKAAQRAFEDARKFLIQAGEQLLDVGKAIKQVASCFQLISASNINFKSKVDLTHRGIDANPKQFFCCLLNLLFNAQEAIDTQDGEIRLEAHADSIDPNKIRISISDTRPVHSLSDDLGWDEVDSFVTQANGGVDITFGADHGMKVDLVLPAISPAEVRQPIHLSSDFTSSLQGCRVLLVEDEPDLALATQSILKRIGYETVTVSSGGEAQRIINLIGDHFDVVLSDYRLTGSINGADVLRFSRRRHPQVPVVLVSATPHECSDTHDLPVLEKPICWQILEEMIRLQMDRHPFRTA